MSKTTFKDVQKILDDAVENAASIGAHGKFWKDVSRDDFVKKAIYGCPILHSKDGKYVGPESPLIRILKEQIKDCKEKTRPRMPAGGYNYLSSDKIATISDWIDDQCPE